MLVNNIYILLMALLDISTDFQEKIKDITNYNYYK